jgi:acyl transferase domain-containing protein
MKPRKALQQNSSYPRIYPVIISGHTRKATEELVGVIKEKLESLQRDSKMDEHDLLDLSYTLTCRRNHFAFRFSATANDMEDLLKQMNNPKVIRIENFEEAKNICFAYTGQGAQYFSMGRELLNTEPSFHQTLLECDGIIKHHMNWSLLEELGKSESESNINRADISQPACVALQIGLTRLWSKYGIVPDVIVGHSSGEIGAAFCAGILDLEEAMLASIFRATSLRDTISEVPGLFDVVDLVLLILIHL